MSACLPVLKNKNNTLLLRVSIVFLSPAYVVKICVTRSSSSDYLLGRPYLPPVGQGGTALSQHHPGDLSTAPLSRGTTGTTALVVR